MSGGRSRRRTTLPRSTRGWSRGIVWSLIALAGFGAVYGSIARLDTSVSADGKLRPVGGVTTVRTPFNARISRLLVREGELVQAGQPLARIDDRALREQLQNLTASQLLWRDEVAVVGRQLGLSDANVAAVATAEATAKATAGAKAEHPSAALKADTDELALRQAMARQDRLRSAIQLRQLQGDLDALRSRLAINTNIRRRLERLQRQGAIAQLELDRHIDRQLDLAAQVQRSARELEISRRRLATSALQERQVEVSNRRELFPRYDRARNQLIEISNRLLEVRERLRQAELRAPQSGRVFDLRYSNGETIAAGQPLLQIVAQQGLEAELQISNRDIAFLRPGMPVEVRITSLPFTDYGAIEGTLVRVGADALPVDGNRPQESFAAVVRLQAAALNRRGRRFELRSGMAVTGLIQLGSRPALALISDRLGSFAESTRSLR
jgi:HlyD family secretion protein